VINKITALIAVLACKGLIAFVAPGFAGEIAAVALRSGKRRAGIDDGILATEAPGFGVPGGSLAI
jgi:hypothetical protein